MYPSSLLEPDTDQSFIAERNSNDATLVALEDETKNEVNAQEKEKSAFAFRRRFGINRLIFKNKDMLNALKNPSAEIDKINKDYNILALKLSKQYRRVYTALLEAGYSVEESKRRADEYIAPLIMAEVKLIKAHHPFALSSGKGKEGKSSMMEQLYHRLRGHRAGAPANAELPAAGRGTGLGDESLSIATALGEPGKSS